MDYDRVAVVSVAIIAGSYLLKKLTNIALQTDEQAPLPDALQQLLQRVQSGLNTATDFVFNCQMGRGRRL